MESLRGERGVILNWITRTVVWFGLAVVVLFDAAAVVVNHVGLDSTTQDIAHALATDETGGDRPASPQLVESARQLARDAEARLLDVSIDPQGVLHLRLRRAANTLIVSKVDAFKKWGRATATARVATS
jgi:hypothetical protein